INEVGPIEICGQGPGVLTCNTSNDFNYQWLRYGLPAPGMNNDSVYYVTKRGNYKIRITNAGGCTSTSSKIVLRKNQKPKAELDLTGPIFSCIGDSVVLKAQVSRGTQPYTSYQWSRYNKVLVGETLDSLVVTSKGGYSVRIYDSKGCTDKSPRTVTEFVACPRLASDNTEVIDLIMNVRPNPFTNSIKVNLIGGSTSAISIRMLDAIGRVVYNDSKPVFSDYEINTANFNNGLYILEVVQGEKLERIKLVKNQ
ncbi:MAG: T9SS type A sorting domain-containing protein, partial [Bacteroidia bacterium]|nr:T9SS type A sorting domain-containing protein [Bacteroidia bacterium]